jgi:hypothetical protein
MGPKTDLLKLKSVNESMNVSGPLLVSRTGDVGCSNRRDKVLK